MTSESRLLRCYSGQAPDHPGRLFDDILALTNDAIEHAHDFIQWIFPLETPSNSDREAPKLIATDVQHFKADAHLVEQAIRALERMLEFYGFELDEDDDGWRVIPARGHEALFRQWLTPGNHNFLRITRILRFLVRIGQVSLARAFWRALADVARRYRGTIGGQTIAFWCDAVEDGSPWTEPCASKSQTTSPDRF